MFERTRRSLVALAVLASLTGVLWLEYFGNHTDDGCRTEVHCLACRTALVRPAAAAAPVAAAPVVVALETVVSRSVARAHDVVPDGRSSRGPPLSA